MSDISNPHDKFFKETFTRLELARDFFANYLPEAVTAVLNLDSLTLQSGSFIDPDLQTQFADLLYQVNLNDGSEAYLYLLLEHKSYPDPQTLFQLLRYEVRIWERDSREGLSLRPIIPIVVYHGRERWRLATDFAGLFTGPEVLRPYWPSFHYQLQDLSALSDDEVRGQAQLQAALLVLKYIFDPALHGRFREIIALFTDLAQTETALEYLETVLYYIGKANTYLAPEEMVIIVQEVLANKGSDIMQTVADHWIEQGRIQNLHDNILDLIDIRFGAVSEELAKRITAVSDPDTLRQLLREAATAVTMTAFTEKLAALIETE
jgi:predicted transposase/invertase (TIGR01784 family)